jgi:hypothetical protein
MAVRTDSRSLRNESVGNASSKLDRREIGVRVDVVLQQGGKLVVMDTLGCAVNARKEDETAMKRNPSNTGRAGWNRKAANWAGLIILLLRCGVISTVERNAWRSNMHASDSVKKKSKNHPRDPIRKLSSPALSRLSSLDQRSIRKSSRGCGGVFGRDAGRIREEVLEPDKAEE